MRRRFLSLAMTLVMALTLLPATAWADDKGEECAAGLDCTEHVAAIGSKHYVTMQEAVDAVPASGTEATTITLLNKWEISGAQVSAGKKIIFDFRDKEYTMVPPTVGSPGTETNGFQLLKGSTVTMRNGTLRAGTYLDLQVLIQNYCDLTLDYMTIDISNAPQCGYAASNNHGVVSIKDSEITAAEGQVAVDVYYWPDNGYDDGVSVTVTSSTINGDITYGSDGTTTGTEDIAKKAALKITSGTVNGLISTYKLGSDNDTGIQVSGGNFSSVLPTAYCTSSVVQVVGGDGRSSVVSQSSAESQGYLRVEGETGIYYTDETAVAQYNEAKVASGSTTTYYATLEDAIDAVNAMNPAPAEGSEATITLLDDVSITSMPGGAYEFFALPANTTLNGATHHITVDVPVVSGHSPWYHVIGTSGKNVRIENLTIAGDYRSGNDDYCTRAGIHAYAGAEVEISNVTISGCGSVAVQVNGSAVTADNLVASGNNWGSVNVDDGSTGAIPSFTFKGGDLQDDVQIYTELTGEDNNNIITVEDSSLFQVNSSGSSGDSTGLKGFVYYTDNPAKLGEAYNENTKKVYTDLDTALSEAVEGGYITVLNNATLDTTTEIKTGVTLAVARGVILTVNSTLTNNGTIVNNGTIEGEEHITGGSGSVTVAVTFNVTPPNANVAVTGAKPVQGNSKVFLLESGRNYTYTVSASGYYNYTGSVPVGTDAQTVNVTLTQIPSTPSYDSGSSNPTYSNTIEAGDGGTVKVSPRTPEAGDTVTITPDPDAGYEVDEVIVTDRSGDEVRVTANRNGTYTFKQPRGRVTIEVTFVRTGDTGLPFLDVAENAWYADAVAYVYENGLMSGTASNLFSPDATTTRGMIVTMLYRLEGEPRVTTGSAFNDVDAAMYYADAIAWANANGIVTGYDEATFGPNDAITREQMAAILYRYAQYKGYDTTQGGMAIREYADYESISEYALTAMDWAVSAGLVTGTSNTTLTPDGSAVRAQVATIFMRFMEDMAG